MSRRSVTRAAARRSRCSKSHVLSRSTSTCNSPLLYFRGRDGRRPACARDCSPRVPRQRVFERRELGVRCVHLLFRVRELRARLNRLDPRVGDEGFPGRPARASDGEEVVPHLGKEFAPSLHWRRTSSVSSSNATRVSRARPPQPPRRRRSRMSRRGCHRRGLLRGGARGPDWLAATRRPLPAHALHRRVHPPFQRSDRLPRARPGPRRAAVRAAAARSNTGASSTKATSRSTHAGGLSRPGRRNLASLRSVASTFPSALPAPSAASAAASESTRTLRSLSSAVSARLCERVDGRVGWRVGARMSASARGAGSVGANRGRSEEPPEMNSSERSSLDGRRHGMPGFLYAAVLVRRPPSTRTTHTVNAPPTARHRPSTRSSAAIRSRSTVRRMMRSPRAGWTEPRSTLPAAVVSPLGGRVSRCVRWFSRFASRRVAGRASPTVRTVRVARRGCQNRRRVTVLFPDFPTSGNA